MEAVKTQRRSLFSNNRKAFKFISEDKRPTMKQKTSRPIILVIVAIVIGVVIIAVQQMAREGRSSLKITSPIKRCQLIEVPYEVQEEYQVDFRFEVIEPRKDEVLKGFDVWAQGIITVRNVESETGLFTVEQTFRTLNQAPIMRKSSGYIMPGEVKVFVEEFDIDLGEDFEINYVVIPPKRTLTRVVTKYRQEERCA